MPSASVSTAESVETEADGIEDAGLAGARATGDQEDAVVGESIEVDGLPLAERTEPFDLQSVQLHQRVFFTVGE